MNVRRWMGPALGLLVLATLGGVARGQEKFEWTIFAKEGKPFYQELHTLTTQTMKVSDVTFSQKQDQTFWFEWTPKGEKDGKYIVEQKIVGLKMDIEIGGNKINYSTKDKNPPQNPMTQFFKELEKATFTLTIDKATMKVEKIEGVKDLIEKLAKVNKSMEPLLKEILSDEAVKQMSDPMFGIAPTKDEMDKKDKKAWTKKSELKMGPIGTYDTTNIFKVESEKDSKATLSVTTKLEYKIPSADAAKKGGLPFKILEATLKSSEGKGTIVFNKTKDKGRVESAKLNVKLEGDLKVEISGMSTMVNLTQVQDVELKELEKNPIEKEKAK